MELRLYSLTVER
ncbi:hypothetical protein PENFLA_c078G00610 [Penicillium flavigenum]|uniref:Uncharacterized protein n=1 Tax=Penicillium flavigenum TaxID=254877 RepID=A0A1V6SAX0_9EURO|nr:hypothetical protein PENFLA_c078G00610 [Penicillium flavigenum]